MAREFMCEYGNCAETNDLRITVTDRGGGERARFCSHEHAGLWLLRRAWMYGQRNDATVVRLANAAFRDLK